MAVIIYLIFLEHLLGTRHYAREDRHGWPALNGAWWVICVLNKESHKQIYNYNCYKCCEGGSQVVSEPQTKDLPEIYLSEITLPTPPPRKKEFLWKAIA